MAYAHRQVSAALWAETGQPDFYYPNSLARSPLTPPPPPAPRAKALGASDRLGERQESRFENLKVFEFDPMRLGGSAPKPPGFFEA